MKTWTIPAVLLAATLSLTGCDNPSDSRPAASEPVGEPIEYHESVEIDDPAPDRDRLDINIDVDTDDPATSERAELRQQRRENLRDAIDNIDVRVGEQGVDVNVD